MANWVLEQIRCKFDSGLTPRQVREQLPQADWTQVERIRRKLNIPRNADILARNQQIRALKANGSTHRAIAEQFNLTAPGVSFILKQKTTDILPG